MDLESNGSSKEGSPRHRSHRSRDRRSHSRERSRRRSHHQSRSHRKDSDYEYEDEDSSSRSHSRKRRHRSPVRSKDRTPEASRQRRRNSGEIPDQTIMVRGLGADVTEEDIRNAVLSSKLEPKDIRLMRYKDGVSRGFAFVEFHLLSDAVRWKELTQSEVTLRGGRKASLYYSIRENIHADKVGTPIQHLDWNCYKCGMTNFRRRMQCFKCACPRELSEMAPTPGENSLDAASNSYMDRSALVLSNLSPLTTEETVLSALGQLTQLPIKALRLVRQLPNIRCLVEMNSAAEAAQLHDLLQAASPLTIDATTVVVSYAKKTMSYQKSVATANVASVALAAAQWTNHVDNTSQPHSTVSMQEPSMPITNLGRVTINGVSYPKYPPPDVSTFQYDQTSGFYYNSQTGLYYDASSQYFYHPVSQKYMYWDGEHHTYLPAPGDNSQAVVSSSVVLSAGPVITKPPSGGRGAKSLQQQQLPQQRTDKNKVAKKIAKDMEKWAKAMNIKKEEAATKPLEQPTPPPSKPMAPEPAVAPVAPAATATVEKPESLAGIVAAYGESDSEDDNRALEAWSRELAGLLDWTKLVCRLCKRQFHSKDLLTKHQQLSSLHSQNLAALKHSKLSSSQIEELDRREANYRDRAKERREKFGLPEQAQTNCLKEHYMKHLQVINREEPAKQQKIGGDTIGSRMLKAMGWSEGQGLGKDNQGTSSIIEVSSRPGHCAGLGVKSAAVPSNNPATPFDYRENGKKIMQARYREMTANE